MAPQRAEVDRIASYAPHPLRHSGATYDADKGAVKGAVKRGGGRRRCAEFEEVVIASRFANPARQDTHSIHDAMALEGDRWAEKGWRDRI